MCISLSPEPNKIAPNYSRTKEMERLLKSASQKREHKYSAWTAAQHDRELTHLLS